jgi:hypothetical protein
LTVETVSRSRFTHRETWPVCGAGRLALALPRIRAKPASLPKLPSCPRPPVLALSIDSCRKQDSVYAKSRAASTATQPSIGAVTSLSPIRSRVLLLRLWLGCSAWAFIPTACPSRVPGSRPSWASPPVEPSAWLSLSPPNPPWPCLSVVCLPQALPSGAARGPPRGT